MDFTGQILRRFILSELAQLASGRPEHNRIAPSAGRFYTSKPKDRPPRSGNCLGVALSHENLACNRRNCYAVQLSSS